MINCNYSGLHPAKSQRLHTNCKNSRLRQIIPWRQRSVLYMNPRIWGDKSYYSLNHYLKETYGEKIYKVSLDGGMTCPNRDGTIGTAGCIFCSEGGSGDFASSRTLSVSRQIGAGISLLSRKSAGHKFIAYFQAYTNTYAPVEYLRKIFTEAISHPDVVILSIATRPDCLSGEILDLLAELNRIKPVWIELGLQTIHPDSAEFINRGYPLSCFDSALSELKLRGIPVVVHVILGLPGETEEDMLKTTDYLASAGIQGIKLQLLHVLKNTVLAECFSRGEFDVLTFEGYIDTLIRCIEHLPEEIIIHRITGDGPKNLLIAPQWSSNKKLVLNTIHRELKTRNSWQGKFKEEHACQNH